MTTPLASRHLSSLSLFLAMGVSVLACSHHETGERAGQTQHGFTENDDPGDNIFPSAALPLKSFDDVAGEINGNFFSDFYVTTARGGDRVFAYVETPGSTITDPSLHLFSGAGDATTPLEVDDNDGPGLTAVIANHEVPAHIDDVVYLAVSNDAGLLNYRLSSYVADPADVQVEVEANENVLTAEPLTAPMVVGEIGVQDEDYYAFHAEPGDAIVVMMDDNPNGVINAPTLLEVRNPADQVVATGDNQLGAAGNATPRVIATLPGTHYVRVANSTINLSGAYTFVVLVNGRPAAAPMAMQEEENNETLAQANGLRNRHGAVGSIVVASDTRDTWRIRGNVGDHIFTLVDAQQATPSDHVDLSIRNHVGFPIAGDDGDGPGNGSVVAGARMSNETSYIYVSEPDGDVVSDYHLFAAVVNDLDVMIESESATPGAESNDTPNTADAITATRIRADATAGDVDYFEVPARAGDNIVVMVNEEPDGEPLDLTVSIRNPADTAIAVGDNLETPLPPHANGAGPVEAAEDGTYYVRVANDDATSNEARFYEMVVLVTSGPVACGDGDLDAIEACDDGNVASGDGCDQLCRVEPGYTCAGEPSTCSEESGTGGAGGAGAGAGGSGDVGGGSSSGGEGGESVGGGSDGGAATPTGGGNDAAGDDGGCSFRAAPEEGTPRWAGWLPLLGLAALRRRRRREN